MALLRLLLQNGLTPLHVAAQNGQQAVVNQLLVAGADIQATDKVSPYLLCLRQCSWLQATHRWPFASYMLLQTEFDQSRLMCSVN